MSEENADFTRLDDPEFLAERARVRERLGELPAGHADYAGLTARYAALSDEFLRRAAVAWTQAGLEEINGH